MTPLRRRMIEDMQLRNLAAVTQRNYIARVAAFARFFGQSPEFLDQEAVREYLLYLLNERKMSLGDFTTTVRVLPIAGMAMVIGVIGAYVALALLRLIGFFTNLFYYQRLGSALVSPAGNHMGWLAVLVPVGGGLIIGLMARYESDMLGELDYRETAYAARRVFEQRATHAFPSEFVMPEEWRAELEEMAKELGFPLRTSAAIEQRFLEVIQMLERAARADG